MYFRGWPSIIPFHIEPEQRYPRLAKTSTGVLIVTDSLESDADYLNLLTRKLFHSGFNKSLVDQKWPAFESAFGRFKPSVVAEFNEMDIARLRADSTIVRHRLKIRATIKNAQSFVAMAATHGSWHAWLKSLRVLTYQERESILHQALTHCGPNTIYYFLLEAGETGADQKPRSVR
jgi:DNA-3-methyladenine glycosylase I